MRDRRAFVKPYHQIAELQPRVGDFDLTLSLEALPYAPFLTDAPLAVQVGAAQVGVLQNELHPQFDPKLTELILATKSAFGFCRHINRDPRGPHSIPEDVVLKHAARLPGLRFAPGWLDSRWGTVLSHDKYCAVLFVSEAPPSDDVFWHEISVQVIDWEGRPIAVEVLTEWGGILVPRGHGSDFNFTPYGICSKTRSYITSLLQYSCKKEVCESFRLLNVSKGLILRCDDSDGLDETFCANFYIPTHSLHGGLDVVGQRTLAAGSVSGSFAVALPVDNPLNHMQKALTAQLPDGFSGFFCSGFVDPRPCLFRSGSPDDSSVVLVSECEATHDLRGVETVDVVSFEENMLRARGPGIHRNVLLQLPLRNKEEEATVTDLIDTYFPSAQCIVRRRQVCDMPDALRQEIICDIPRLFNAGWRTADKIAAAFRLPCQPVLDVLRQILPATHQRSFEFAGDLFYLDKFRFPDDFILPLMMAISLEPSGVICALQDNSVAERIHTNPREPGFPTAIKHKPEIGYIPSSEFADILKIPERAVLNWAGSRKSVYIPAIWADWMRVPRPATLLGHVCGGAVNIIRVIAGSPRMRAALLLQTIST